jgi:hypothetical protein
MEPARRATFSTLLSLESTSSTSKLAVILFWLQLNIFNIVRYNKIEERLNRKNEGAVYFTVSRAPHL